MDVVRIFVKKKLFLIPVIVCCPCQVMCCAYKLCWCMLTLFYQGRCMRAHDVSTWVGAVAHTMLTTDHERPMPWHLKT